MFADPNPDKPELKIEDLMMSLAQRRRLRPVSLCLFKMERIP